MRNEREPRVRPARLEPVEVQIIGEGFLHILHARDISSGGLGIHVPHGFGRSEPDTEIELVLTLPRRQPFRVCGRIRHRTEYDGEVFFGVEFRELSWRQRILIKRYVGRRLKQTSGVR